MISKKAKAIMAALKAAMPFVEKLDIEKHRKAQDYIGLFLKPAKGVFFKDVEVGGVKAAWAMPHRQQIEGQDAATGWNPKDKKVILHCHGGAFTSGGLKYSKIFASRLAALTGINVFTYEYRLAPEHPFPAALEDSLKVYSFLLEKGFLPENIVLIGESAGGNLCLSIVCAARMEGLPDPGALILLSPWLDLSGSGDTYYSLADKDPSLNPHTLMESARHYAGENDLTDPLISPLFADLTGIPPTLIQAGTNEILLSDATRLYDLLKVHGVKAVIQLFEEMFHVFQLVDIPESKEALEKIKKFVDCHFALE